jgi:hypothetical protein
MDKNGVFPMALNRRKIKAIPLIVAAKTYKEGCEAAQIAPSTFYEWLKDTEFKAELDRQRRQVCEEAFNTLEHSLTKAVETLTALLDTSDDRLRRLAANDVIEHIIEHRELEDIEDRLAAIEQRLNERS